MNHSRLQRPLAHPALAAGCLWVCAAALSPAWAHPDTKDNFRVGPTPGGSTVPAELEPSTPPQARNQGGPAAMPPQAAPRLERQPGGPSTQAPIQPPIRPGKPWLEKQQAAGYTSNVLMRVGQVAHGHASKPPEREPVEVWYVATRKPHTAGQVVYCVAPRIEVPGPTAWDEPSFALTLHRPGQAPASITVAGAYPATASRELQAAGPAWCSGPQRAEQMPPRDWVLETDHGQAYVVFPYPRPGSR